MSFNFVKIWTPISFFFNGSVHFWVELKACKSVKDRGTIRYLSKADSSTDYRYESRTGPLFCFASTNS